MINIFSIKCSLVFAPYLWETVTEYLAGTPVAARVVRQGGTGLILRSDGELVLRHEDRQVSLGTEDVRHYAATIQMRIEFYDILRMQDEVVLATVGDELLLSHPQSQMWLTRGTVGVLETVFANQSTAESEERLEGAPEWLKVSTGGGRLLLSDQRTGRWVLLGDDHIGELKRRLETPSQTAKAALRPPTPPTISIKGLTVHLQSAFKLSSTLAEFSDNGNVTPFEEITPNYSLRASMCTEGIELRDSDIRVALTAREARKWSSILDDELERLNAHQAERGRIRTVFADGEGGRWVLHWGDEVFVRRGAQVRNESQSGVLEDEELMVGKRSGEFLLLLNPATGSCVALNNAESRHLDESLA